MEAKSTAGCRHSLRGPSGAIGSSSSRSRSYLWDLLEEVVDVLVVDLSEGDPDGVGNAVIVQLQLLSTPRPEFRGRKIICLTFQTNYCFKKKFLNLFLFKFMMKRLWALVRPVVRSLS
jgi:hypothetical protein